MRDVERWDRRERKVRRRRHGMRIDGRGIFILEEIAKKKAEKARRRAGTITQENENDEL